MSYLSHRSGYAEFVERLNRFPQGDPPSPALYKILKILLSEGEAGLIAQLPIKSFTAHQAAAIWKMPIQQAVSILDGLAGRTLLADIEFEGQTTHVLPPPMAGFFEFSIFQWVVENYFTGPHRPSLQLNRAGEL